MLSGVRGACSSAGGQQLRSVRDGLALGAQHMRGETAQHEAEMMEKDLLASRAESEVLAKKCAELERHVAYIEQFLLQKGRAAPAPPASE